MVDSLLANWPAWAVLVYVLLRDVVPRIAPDFFKFLSKRTTNEDRLFKLLEDNAKNDKALVTTLTKFESSLDLFAGALHSIDQRVDHIEDMLQQKED